jgi:vacuolar-type H+-ATPase subunit E/Vma4
MTVTGGVMQPVFESLRAEAEREAQALREEARAEAERILASAREHVAARRHAEIVAEEVEPRRKAARSLAAARRDGAVNILQGRRRLTDHVLQLASSRYADGNPLPREALAHLVRDALAYLPPTTVRVSCHPDSVDAVRALIAGHPAAAVAGDSSLSAGVRIAAADGSVLVDNTLATRIQQRRDELSAMVVRAAAGAA